MIFHLWIDDMRQPPHKENLFAFKNAETAIEWLNKNHRSIINEDVIKIYLDHDLGYGKTGYDFAKWFVEWNLDKNFFMTFHVLSNNPVGVFNIRQLFSHYGYKEF